MYDEHAWYDITLIKCNYAKHKYYTISLSILKAIKLFWAGWKSLKIALHRAYIKCKSVFMCV